MSKPEQTASTPSPDVVIVGGGVMGCATALRLAQKGVSVTVVERGIPGAEASSAAAGILGPQWEAEGAGPLLDLGLRSRALYPSFAAELRELAGQDIGYAKSGLLEVALDETQERALLARRAWQHARGLRAEMLGPADLLKAEPNLGPGVRAGLRLPDEGHLNARALARSLSQAAAIAGAKFLQGHYVRRVVTAGNRVTGVELDGETVHAGAVVIAAGSWSSLVEGGGVPPPTVRPARGQMVAIEMRPPLFRHVIAAYGRGYLVPRLDGTVLAGSTLEMVGYRKEVTVAGLAEILGMVRALMPGLDHAPVVETWSNFRPYTDDHLPVLGRTAVEGLVLATGHHRYGILLTPITAQLVTELITTGVTSVDLAPFSVARFSARPS
jgi:glycine oxidase